MERGRKIKILEAIAAGDITKVGQPLPTVYLKKYSTQADIREDVSIKYGKGAAVIFTRTGAIVISIYKGRWIFYEKPETGNYSDGLTQYSKAEYKQLVQALLDVSEGQETPSITTFIHQPGNEPIIETEDII